MAASPLPSARTEWRGPGMREFVALMAALMASNALAIDAMLPALAAIGEDLGVEAENRRQLVISFYMIGFGAAQLIYGPLADRLGRRMILIISLGFYTLFAIARGLAGGFGGRVGARGAPGG